MRNNNINIQKTYKLEIDKNIKQLIAFLNSVRQEERINKNDRNRKKTKVS